MVLGDYSFALLSTLAGVVYPLYQSFKALKADTAAVWLPYWLVFVLFTTLGYPLDLIFSAWVPLWYEIKLGIIVSLQPDTVNLAKTLYDTKLEPALLELDKKLANDDRLLAIQAQFEKFNKMSLQEKWALLKDVDIKSTVQSAQAFLTKAGAKSTTTPPEPRTPSDAKAKSSTVDEPSELSEAPSEPSEAPSSPGHRSGASDDAEMVEPEDAPLPPAAEPVAKKTQ